MLAAFAALTLAGCSGDRFVGPQQVMLRDPPKQSEAPPAARREHQRILATYGGAYEDARIEAMVTKTVDRLVAASERPDQRYKVTILNSPAVNAFALPTGNIYVTRGLIALANDNSELASVLAHEMSHVIAQHAATREDQAKQAAIVSRVVSDVVSDPQVGALALAKSKLAMASFSRAQEFEADGIGVGIAAKSGYDAFGAVRFLTSMGRNADLKTTGSGGDPRSLDFLSSHPATPDRIRNAQTNARQYGASAAGERDRGAYFAGIDGLVYGEDPIEGYVRGRRFLHPKLGFTFTAPDGFTLENTAQAVLGLKEGGSQAMRLDVVRVPPEQKLTDYLKSGWIENVDPASAEETTISGFPAATATAKGDLWAFRLYVIRFGSEVYRFIYAAKSKSAESDHVFRESVGSFRRLTLAEIDQAKPLRIKVVTVGPNDTVDKLATRMALIDRQVDRFRVLNGLDANDRVKAGDQVKIVVE
jgi:predicted Zn-dependent protease